MSPSSDSSASVPQPVTVSITRSVDPKRVVEVSRWVQNGVRLASRWPGFLGSGWVRAAADSNDWHMLYRFADQRSLDAWESSDQLARWLEGGRGMVEERRVKRRTGIEGWFDAPTPMTETDRRLDSSPPRWKQAVSIWLGFFPLNLLFTWLIGSVLPVWDDLWVLIRVLVTTLILTPIMAYWVLPFVTARLQRWLTAEGSG